MQADLDAFEGKITLKEENTAAGRASTGAGGQAESKNYEPSRGVESKISDNTASSSPFLNEAPSQINDKQKEDISFLSPQDNTRPGVATSVQNRNNLPWEEKARMNQP